ncbi:MAG TPA: hypothetical protein DHW39_11465 [Erysipelotrichaceae bacterium]|nr:hypothetical protein [Erysipelotrichaceae bacterium]
MDFKNLKDETKEMIKALAISGSLIVLFYVLINNLKPIASVLMSSLSAMAPFLIGLIFVFLLEPVRRMAEEKWLVNLKAEPRAKRKLAVTIAMVVCLLCLFAFFMILIPQLMSSLRIFIGSFDSYVATLRNMIDSLDGIDQNVEAALIEALNTTGSKLLEWLTGAEGGLVQILSYSVSVLKGVMNFFIGLIIALYILLDEERFKLQIKKLIYGLMDRKRADSTMHLLRLTMRTFNSFIFGKAIDSLLIGFICWICCMVMRMPYGPLISVVVGVTNMIPVFGPFIGAVPCILILLIINPIKALEFSVFILILQQIDGNIIGPRILGDAVGLPTLWVMFAIIVGGAMLGIVGMFVGVPIFSVVYALVRDYCYGQLKEKDVSFLNL